MSTGTYADGRPYALPGSWPVAERDMLDEVTERALAAFDGAVSRVITYYDPETEYAGDLLTALDCLEHDLPGQAPKENRITAADLVAVASLSMKIPALTTRRLLRPSTASQEATSLLSSIPGAMSITALDSEHMGAPLLERMQALQTLLRTVHQESSNRWVFAAKLAARKRPYLFPVRDNVVCSLLAGGPLRTTGLGQFSTDIQVYAYLMTHPTVVGRLAELRAEVTASGADAARHVEASDLRLLDVVLWTRGAGRDR